MVEYTPAVYNWCSTTCWTAITSSCSIIDCVSRIFSVLFNISHKTWYIIFIAMFFFFTELLPPTQIQLGWNTRYLWLNKWYNLSSVEKFSSSWCLLTPIWICHLNSATLYICCFLWSNDPRNMLVYFLRWGVNIIFKSTSKFTILYLLNKI